MTRDLVTMWEVAVEQYVQKKARERTVPESMVRNELSMPPAVYDLLGQIPRLLARNLVHIEDERAQIERERRQQVLQWFTQEAQNSKVEEPNKPR